METLKQYADPVTITYQHNGIEKQISYTPLIVKGRVYDDNQRRAIEILYYHNIKFPILKNKELDQFIETGKITLKNGRRTDSFYFPLQIS